MAKTNQKKKKNVKVDAAGEAHIQASFNNVIISLTNNAGQVISWSSAGKMGFKGSKKNTPYAAQIAGEGVLAVFVTELVYHYVVNVRKTTLEQEKVRERQLQTRKKQLNNK